MSRKDAGDRIKAFMMTNQLASEDLQKIGATFSVDLGHLPISTQALQDTYYPQFDAAVRAEAALMSKHYETFYCLEKSIRALVDETFQVTEGTGWWGSSRVPPNLQSEVASRIKREEDSAVTSRSESELDYTTFGELAVIITANWDIFGGLFSSRKAVEKVMASLNLLRGPIAHCSPLADDEVQRLHLTVRDWFRLME
jgi:hypothetical protein